MHLITKKVTITAIQKHELLKLLTDYFRYNEKNDPDFSLEKMELFIFSKTFSDFCINEIISIEEQIKLIYGFIVLKMNKNRFISISLYFFLMGMVLYWSKFMKNREISYIDKKTLSFFLEIFTQNKEIPNNFYHKFGEFNDGIKIFSKEIHFFLNLSETNEKNLVLEYLNLKIERNILKITKESSEFAIFQNRKQKDLTNCFLFVLSEKYNLFSLYDRKYKIILKMIYNKMKGKEFSYFLIFNEQKLTSNCFFDFILNIN